MRFNSLLMWIIIFTIMLNYIKGDEVILLEDTINEHPTKLVLIKEQSNAEVLHNSNETQQSINFIDWIGLRTRQYLNLYLDKTTKGCSTGELVDYFMFFAMNKFLEFFNHKQYTMNDNIKSFKMPKIIINDEDKHAYRYFNVIRSDDSKWNEDLKITLKKFEKLMKAITFEEFVPFWLTKDNKIHIPRFLDEIADEIDVLENKRDTLFSRNRLKQLLIPMLIVLKLFKLKLLLFLPLILGLVSFKKFLGFVAIVIPSLMGFLKLYTLVAQVYTPPVYLPSGVGFPLGYNKENHGFNHVYELDQLGLKEYEDRSNYGVDKIISAQKLAYQGYQKNQN